MLNREQKITFIKINENKSLNLSNPPEKFQVFNWFCIDRDYPFKTSYIFEIISGCTLSTYLESPEYSRAVVHKNINLFFNLFYRDEYNNFIEEYISNYKEDSDLLKKSRINELIKNLEKFIFYHWETKVSIYIFNRELKIKGLKIKEEFNIDDKYLYPNCHIWSHLKGIYDLIWNNYSGYIDNSRIKFNYAYSHQEKPEKKYNLPQETSPKSKKNNISNHKRDEILSFLIGDSMSIEKFEKYEEKLITRNFLNDSRDTWLTSASDFLRFYNYCHKQSIFKNFLEKGSKGVKKLRILYNFFTETKADAYGKRQQKETKTKKDQFNFLD
ncbi:hypothetical protein MK851_09905 [Tenacibaculum sp. 1B UA]|uniref:hypothetical protein n=1 Tax=Tenacibaculum sp. 1B UA TaxID=2922252 RepID=UPI002A2494AF|nr:hypothetical protein [Tenacibaculum sp. 1B UA]MDX8553932.1 hypothetical protein [Tenacibaculum sp. 1B UA]